MRAAVAGAAERAAAAAGVSGDKAARGDQQQLDSVLAGRGQAGAQAGHGPPVRRLPQELGHHALVLQVPPVPDDAAAKVTDLRRGQGVRVGDETAGELVAQPGREDSKELRDRVLVGSPAGSGGTHRYSESSDGPAARTSSSLSTSARLIMAPPNGWTAAVPGKAGHYVVHKATAATGVQ